MLNEIRQLFKKSVDAFRHEMGVSEPEDQIAELLASMRRELVAAKAAIPEFEADVERTRAELAREREALTACERRSGMAERIGDVETVRIAGEFATRHREKIAILEQKVLAVDAELALRRREAEEMKVRYREADANRFGLLAQLRRANAAERVRAAGSAEEGAFADFDRMQERVEQDASYVEALEEIEGTPPPASDSAGAIEDRLRELKRRMGRPE